MNARAIAAAVAPVDPAGAVVRGAAENGAAPAARVGIDSSPAVGRTPSWLGAFALARRDLLRFLRRRTGCEHTAHDLAQDTWLRAAEYEQRGDSEPPASAEHARAWLFTVAERLAIDHLRRQRHWQHALVPQLQGYGDGLAPDVAEAHAFAQALHAVEAALVAMPPRMREVFVAHRIEGVPHDELARRHGVSRKTIEREVSAAMDRAQAALPRAHVAAATPRRGRRQALGALFGLAGLGAGVALAWQAWREHVVQWQTALATPRGRTARLPLPDGSELTLDVGSALDVRLYAVRREVHLLRGAAFCAVARDAERPFVVLAGGARVTALGTRFEVELDAQDGVQVAVESGRVRIEGAQRGAALEVGAGERAHIAAGGMPEALPAPKSHDVAAWRSGWLDFDHVSLGAAVQRLNRYRAGAPLQVDAAVAALPLLARVQIARSHAWVQGLAAVLPVRVLREADGSMRIAPR